jgi:hypothetical protein
MFDFLVLYLQLGLCSFLVLYTAYVVVFTVLHKYGGDEDAIPKAVKYPLYPVFVLGYIGDVVWNWVYGSVLFWQLPLRDKDQTLTKRLNYIYRNYPEGSWRRNISDFVGFKLLNPWDEGHYGP